MSRRMNKSNEKKKINSRSHIHKRRLNNACLYYYVIKYARTHYGAF